MSGVGETKLGRMEKTLRRANKNEQSKDEINLSCLRVFTYDLTHEARDKLKERAKTHIDFGHTLLEGSFTALGQKIEFDQ